MVQDATELSKQFRQNNEQIKKYYETLIKKIECDNPTINALVHTEKLEKQLRQQTFHQNHLTPGNPFAGVPIPLKILGQDKKGWPSTNASKLLKENVATQDSYFVQRLEKEGFIPFGQTNAPEFGFKNISDSQCYGSVRNPLNLAHSAGGSSGGAAAAVTAGFFPIAAANDGGGSIRIPASFCGLIGLKPTRGSMPVGPSNWRSWQGASINFSLTVSMRDTETLFYRLFSQDKKAPFLAPFTPIVENKKKQRKLKIAYCLNSPVQTPVSQEAQIALEEAIYFLKSMGHQLVEIDYPVENGMKLMQSYYQMNAAETASFMNQIESTRQTPIQPGEIEPLSWTLWQYGKKLQASIVVDVLNQWDQSAARMETFFENFDLFLTPTTAYTAPKITDSLIDPQTFSQMKQAEQLTKNELTELVCAMFQPSLTLTPYTQLANLTGQPAISLPTYFSQKTSLPLGIHLMASKGREDLLFEIGYLFEQENQFRLGPDLLKQNLCPNGINHNN